LTRSSTRRSGRARKGRSASRCTRW
jgi:hypothetical protein